eukprot:2502350-Rhodomonas_salina.1
MGAGLADRGALQPVNHHNHRLHAAGRRLPAPENLEGTLLILTFLRAKRHVMNNTLLLPNEADGILLSTANLDDVTLASGSVTGLGVLEDLHVQGSLVFGDEVTRSGFFLPPVPSSVHYSTPHSGTHPPLPAPCPLPSCPPALLCQPSSVCLCLPAGSRLAVALSRLMQCSVVGRWFSFWRSRRFFSVFCFLFSRALWFSRRADIALWREQSGQGTAEGRDSSRSRWLTRRRSWSSSLRMRSAASARARSVVVTLFGEGGWCGVWGRKTACVRGEESCVCVCVCVCLVCILDHARE